MITCSCSYCSHAKQSSTIANFINSSQPPTKTRNGMLSDEVTRYPQTTFFTDHFRFGGNWTQETIINAVCFVRIMNYKSVYKLHMSEHGNQYADGEVRRNLYKKLLFSGCKPPSNGCRSRGMIILAIKHKMTSLTSRQGRRVKPCPVNVNNSLQHPI